MLPYIPYKPYQYRGNRTTEKLVYGLSDFGNGKILGIHEPLMEKFWKKQFHDPSKKTVDEEFLILMSELLNESV